MIKHVNVENYAKIENSKSTSMLVYIHFLQVEKVGDFVLDKKLKKDSSLCNI
jgi:hypothetical protein